MRAKAEPAAAARTAARAAAGRDRFRVREGVEPGEADRSM